MDSPRSLRLASHRDPAVLYHEPCAVYASGLNLPEGSQALGAIPGASVVEAWQAARSAAVACAVCGLRCDGCNAMVILPCCSHIGCVFGLFECAW